MPSAKPTPTMKNTSLRGHRGHGNECPLIEYRPRRTGSFLLSFCRITKAVSTYSNQVLECSCRGESFTKNEFRGGRERESRSDNGFRERPPTRIFEQRVSLGAKMRLRATNGRTQRPCLGSPSTDAGGPKPPKPH